MNNVDDTTKLAIANAFLATLRDPEMAWRDSGAAHFIKRVSETAGLNLSKYDIEGFPMDSDMGANVFLRRWLEGRKVYLLQHYNVLNPDEPMTALTFGMVQGNNVFFTLPPNEVPADNGTEDGLPRDMRLPKAATHDVGPNEDWRTGWNDCREATLKQTAQAQRMAVIKENKRSVAARTNLFPSIGVALMAAQQREGWGVLTCIVPEPELRELARVAFEAHQKANAS